MNVVSTYLSYSGDQHRVQPKVISISQATEYGTVYSPTEVRGLAEFAHKHKMYLHMDGARLCNAAVASNLRLSDMTAGLLVDVLSFGLTKNGAMDAEAVVFFNPHLAKEAKYIRKRAGQLSSKMRYTAAQFTAMLEDDLWHENASHANNMAQLLFSELQGTSNISFPIPVQANEVFAKINPSAVDELQKQYLFYEWDEPGLVRWVTSFATTKIDVLNFAKFIKDTLSRFPL